MAARSGLRHLPKGREEKGRFPGSGSSGVFSRDLRCFLVIYGVFWSKPTGTFGSDYPILKGCHWGRGTGF